MLQFYMGKIRYKTWKSECLERGNFALGEWTFAFKSRGFEERGILFGECLKKIC